MKTKIVPIALVVFAFFILAFLTSCTATVAPYQAPTPQPTQVPSMYMPQPQTIIENSDAEMFLVFLLGVLGGVCFEALIVIAYIIYQTKKEQTNHSPTYSQPTYTTPQPVKPMKVIVVNGELFGATDDTTLIDMLMQNGYPYSTAASIVANTLRQIAPPR